MTRNAVQVNAPSRRAFRLPARLRPPCVVLPPYCHLALTAVRFVIILRTTVAVIIPPTMSTSRA